MVHLRHINVNNIDFLHESGTRYGGGSQSPSNDAPFKKEKSKRKGWTGQFRNYDSVLLLLGNKNNPTTTTTTFACILSNYDDNSAHRRRHATRHRHHQLQRIKPRLM